MTNATVESTNTVNVRAKLGEVRKSITKDGVASFKFKFVGESVRRLSSASREREELALAFADKRRKAKKGLPTVADLMANTPYNIEDLKWDVARGRVELI